MDEDAEFQELRKKRLAQMQSQQQAKSSAEEEEAKIDDQRASMVAQLLTSEARERLNRVALVRPELSKSVSDKIIYLARSGQLQGKLDDATLKKILENAQSTKQETKVTFQRKKYDDDESSSSSESDSDSN